MKDKSYVLGVVELSTFNSIPNIDSTNNKFHVGREVITLPTGSYEISDIERKLKEILSPQKVHLSLVANNNILGSEIMCSEAIDFRPKDSIGRLLGFTGKKSAPGIIHELSLPVKILKINALRVECNITGESYINGEKVYTIHEFFPAVPPGLKIIEVPKKIIYLPITLKTIDRLQLRIVDQDGQPVNFRGEIITTRLHLKQI